MYKPNMKEAKKGRKKPPMKDLWINLYNGEGSAIFKENNKKFGGNLCCR